MVPRASGDRPETLSKAQVEQKPWGACVNLAAPSVVSIARTALPAGVLAKAYASVFFSAAPAVAG
jgi:hypothetical protein